MNDAGSALKSKSELDTGISTLSTGDWIELTTFFNAAIYGNPTTEAKMRIRLDMNDADAFPPEFAETVELFSDLAGLGHEFEHDIVEEVLGLADDIVHYQTKADVVYTRLSDLIDKYDMDGAEGIQDKLDELVKLWGKGEVDGRSEKIKVRFRTALENLISEADTRARRAEALQTAIRGEGGLKERVLKCKSEFDDKHKAFENKFGGESEDVKRFKASLDSLQAELTALRKKESDEVIVLETSPLYLLIPFWGPFILAGVDIGVGVDLAHVRAEISSKVTEANAFQNKIDVAQRFMTYYTNGQTMVKDISDKIEAIAPKLETLGRGWRAIAADLGTIVKSLGDEGRNQIKAEDWFNFVSTLETAKTTWNKVADRADHFRSVAQPQAAPDVKSFLARLDKQAA